MKHIYYFVFGIALMLLTIACNKQEGTYELKGTTEGLADGEQLLLADSEGQIIDTLIVNNGKFSYEGKTDSVCFYSLFIKNDNMVGANFFTEPGTISISITKETGKTKVGGTVANNALQELSDEIDPLYNKIQELENAIYNDTVQTYDQWAVGERYKQLANELTKKFKDAAEKNIDNELGYMLVNRYIDPAEDAELLHKLIAMMPEKYRQRGGIITLEAQLRAAEASEPGQQIADFTLNTPQGEPLSVMSEVKKNKITILDFWASWCGPCRREMPFMKELYAKYQPKGLGIVGISLDESAADWNRAIEDLKIEWPQMSDLKGWECSAAQTFQVRAIPHLIILDSEGKILQKGLRGEELEQFIAQQLQ